jgi:hypothetical protein
VLQLAAHFDVFMGLTMGLVAEPMAAQPVVDRASFYISVSDRSTVSPVIYQGDDLGFIRAAAGRGEHPDPRLPVVG